MSATRGTFIPGEGAISVRLVRGRDEFETYPALAAGAGLSHRLAIVQDTYVEGCGDMFFDEPLWAALVEFIRGRCARVTALVERPNRQPKELAMDSFLEEWSRTESEDKYPPFAIVGHAEDKVRVCMVTEYWTRTGGPRLYHDSYTYSLYSDRDPAADVRAFLERAPGRDRWDLAEGITDLTPDYFAADFAQPPPSLLDRLVSWMGVRPKF